MKRQPTEWEEIFVNKVTDHAAQQQQKKKLKNGQKT